MSGFDVKAPGGVMWPQAGARAHQFRPAKLCCGWPHSFLVGVERVQGI